MGEISGSSTVYSYGNEGGIMLMASNDYGPGTVTGGSGDDSGGDYGMPARIFWSIAYDGESSYSGGITASNFYLDPITVYDTQGHPQVIYGPFYGHTPQKLYEMALNTNNLDEVFRDWNSKYPDSVTKFISYLEDVLPQCVSTGVATG
ncbi:MAG TPA: hypothetical protein H9981_11405 [Candidatus Mediterraneibacter caccavium]|uniref:Uncharacterized protein n=1 Tax=Candidatus Mediterraneibacter caccavium TaxID=2838661 RepID=A0A9D1VZF7_9FIRM|nr:hypothetical protein [Candidatus Mediterraneibacter caccavium]